MTSSSPDGIFGKAESWLRLALFLPSVRPDPQQFVCAAQFREAEAGCVGTRSHCGAGQRGCGVFVHMRRGGVVPRLVAVQIIPNLSNRGEEVMPHGGVSVIVTGVTFRVLDVAPGARPVGRPKSSRFLHVDP
ncbi:hypothetical protein GCM10023335_52280 [Streptomyces siamensis]|uniref:Uncharacterized protein n=1 Tax=Streptomyces siamensis TaxID=1274986 RepID=A0ABP9J5M3_9ACTN